MPHNLTLSLEELSTKLASGECTARSLVDAAFTRIQAVDDPERPVFLKLYKEQARANADEIDLARSNGKALPPYAGIPFAVKDLFDIAGETTTAGSVVLKNEAPATRNAVVVQNLLDAGLILIGKTNMTEFAFSGLGLNPHYGTPPAWGTAGESPCAPGGSSSGAGVSIAAGMVPLSLGTDTAGSCRIPAAWNGVTGYKPTQSSMSNQGVFPLSPLLDAPGPFTRRVACSHTAYQLMAGNNPTATPETNIKTLRLAVPKGIAMQDLNPEVEVAFARALSDLKAAGATIEQIDVPEFETAADIFSTAPFAAYDAWMAHRERLATQAEQYDPFVAWRMSNGQNISPETQQANIQRRAMAVQSFSERMAPFDALLMPTTADTPPTLAPLEEDREQFTATNGRALRNTSFINFIDGCAISIPCHRKEEPSMGLCICHAKGLDERLFSAALQCEKLTGSY